MWQPNIDRISSNYKPLQPIVTWNDRKIDTQGCVLAKVIDTKYTVRLLNIWHNNRNRIGEIMIQDSLVFKEPFIC